MCVCLLVRFSFVALPYLCPQILRNYASSLRYRALTTLVKGFRPTKVECEFFMRVLGFDNNDECMAYLEAAGAVIANGSVDTKASELHEPEMEEVSDDEKGTSHLQNICLNSC